MRIPEPKVEHHEGRGIRSCPIFPELQPILDEVFEIFGDKSQYVVAAPRYRAAANTAMGWKNSNLRTEMTRLVQLAGVSVSRVTCWSPRMILRRRPACGRLWCRGESIGGVET